MPSFEFCMKVSDAAYSTMFLRQMGESYYDMSKLAQGDLTLGMINDAYEVQVFKSDFLKSEASDRFADEYFDRCLDNEF